MVSPQIIPDTPCRPGDCPFCDNALAECTCHEYRAQFNRETARVARELTEADAAWDAWVARQNAQQVRTERAQAETFSFSGLSNCFGEPYYRNPVGAPLVRVMTGRGTVYTVSEFDCTCPDHEHTGRSMGVRCKHREAARLAGVFTAARSDQPTADQAQALRMELAAW